MTRKEKEKLLLDGLGLKVGDTVEIKTFSSCYICKLEEGKDEYFLKGNEDEYFTINYLLFLDFEKIEPKKKLGEMKCKDFIDCVNCPLYNFNCKRRINYMEKTLYEILVYQRDEDYNYFKSKLDKEIEE